MKRWNQRPFEIRNLFNPAFCGLILFRAMLGYEEEDPRGMPFSLSLLVLPLCLHKDSREVIAGSPRSYLLKIVEKNPQVQVGFAGRVTRMLPYAFRNVSTALRHFFDRFITSTHPAPAPTRARISYGKLGPSHGKPQTARLSTGPAPLPTGNPPPSACGWKTAKSAVSHRGWSHRGSASCN